jgi:hypothetical protein
MTDTILEIQEVVNELVIGADGEQTVLEVNEPRIEILTIGVQGPSGVQGPPGNVPPAIYFDYGDATPAILFTPDTDRVILSVRLIVLIAFNGSGAKVSIGTAAAPELLMDEDESNLFVVSTYETNPMETILAGTPVKVFITPGSGATQGRCMILFEYADA